MREIKNCEFCSKNKFEFLFYAKDKHHNIPGKFKIVKCKSCGLIFINPQPQGKELERHYPKSYYSFSKITKRRKSKLRVLLYNVYFNPHKGNYLLKFLFLPLKFYLRGTIISKSKKLLDVGCGSGQFLYEMKQLGLEVYGVEPGNFDKKNAKKLDLNIKNTDLIKAKYPSNYFDIITINQVLEHINNPIENLQEIKRIMKKGGILIIGVPNHNCLAHWLFRKNWYALDVPRHLFDYSDKILMDKLKRGGFQIEKIRYNSRPNQFSISLIYALNARKNEIILTLLDILFLPLTYIVNLLKISDQVEIYCRK